MPKSHIWSAALGWVTARATSRAALPVLAAVLVAVLAWRWLGRPVEVTAVAAVHGTAAEIVYATGAVEPVRWAKVASLIRDRIVDLCYCEGKTVAKGDILVRLDDRELRAQLQELKVREEFAKKEMACTTELLGRGVATAQAFDRISSDLRQIQALISVQLEKLDDYTIVAPMDGLVLRRESGGRPSRLQCACRTLLVWAPVTALFVLALPLALVVPGLAAVYFAVWGLGMVLLLTYVVLALRHPARGAHDYLVGTRLVPA